MKLNYVEQGTGDSVFLIHGLFGSLFNLGNLARALVPNYRVISLDLRNHGDFSLRRNGPSFDGYRYCRADG